MSFTEPQRRAPGAQRGRPKQARRNSSIFTVPRESFIGIVIGNKYQLKCFVRADPHADIYLVSLFDDQTSIFTIEAYSLAGLCAQIKSSRKRHIKRRVAKSLEQIEQNGKLYIVFELSGKHSPSGLTLGHNAISPLRDDRPDHLDFVKPHDSDVFHHTLGRVGDSGGVTLDHYLQAVVTTTNDVITGHASPGVACVGSLAVSMVTSRRLEDQLREARYRLHANLHAEQQGHCGTPQDRACLQAIDRFQTWDITDSKYRKILHRCGRILPYPVEISRISKDFGSVSLLRTLEHQRRGQWISFLLSLDLATLETVRFVHTGIICSSLRLEPAYVTYATALKQDFPSSLQKEAPMVVPGKSLKQRDKRRRRRERNQKK